MKSWVCDRRRAVGVLVLVLVALSPTAFAATGRTIGTYDVSLTGAATYTIPIWAPRGPNSLQPQIALAYNSQSANGYVGVGWSLAGLSSIYRCTQTYAQDPAAAPVTLTTSDVFCMDGQRLRLTGGTYGDADSTYQTEVANFANVTAYGSAGNGPSYFEVQGRDGRTYEYGNGGGSQVLAYGTTTAWIWYLDKVTDRAGNTMTITYCTDANSYCTQSGGTASGTAVPVTISWTPSSHGATTYNYTMNFYYSTNVPQSSIYGYVGGTAYSNTSLLSTVTVEYGGTTVKKYALSYGQSPTTGHDELTQVGECADSGETNCLEPTTFTYQSGQVGVSTSATPAISGTAITQLKVHDDFNGDGINDLAYCNNGSPNIIYVAFGSSAGYGSPVNTGIPCTTPLYGDLDASDKDGILVPNGADWWYYSWNGSAFVGEDTELAYDSTAHAYVLADVNGDGYPDLISGYLQSQGTDYNFSIYVRLNTSARNESTCTSSTVCYSSSNNLWYGPIVVDGASIFSDTDWPETRQSYGTLKDLDFNGDGRQDIVLNTRLGHGTTATISSSELISGTSGFTAVAIGGGNALSYPGITFLDFNPDGCTDYVFRGALYISGCNGTAPVQITLGNSNVVGAMDWDGDGRTDILVQNGSTIGVYLSEGDGISSLQTTSVPYVSNDVLFAFDANGDGLDDLGYVQGSTAVGYYLHSGVGQKPDLLSSVTDGYGNFAKPTYVSLAQGAGSTYTPGISFELHDHPDYKPYIDPLYVVSNVTYSNPSNQPNGTYTSTYSYSDAATNIQGRGFAGFATKEVVDSRTGVHETLGYAQYFPLVGLVESDVATQNGSSQETIFSRTYSWAGQSVSLCYACVWPVITTAFDNEYEVGGAEDGQLISSATTGYDYDTYGNTTEIWRTTTDDDPGSPYNGDFWSTKINNTPDVDTGTWCLGLLTEQQISYTASDGSPSVTRTRQYTPDTTNCRYTEIQTEPSSNSYEVSEALGYDSFGNLDSDTVTGISMPARQTTANWGTTGQFPMSITDATGATTQFNYDFSYGLLSSTTDPNGATTSRAYADGFGRVTLETRPDGTYTTYDYNTTCNSGNSYCGTGDPDFSQFVAIRFYGSDRSELYERDLLKNAVGAICVQSQYNISGKVYLDTYYDSLGRVVKQSAPYITSEHDTTYSYDILNRLVQTQRPINQNGGTQTTSYTYEGDTTTVTDPYGHTRTLIHDVNGWPRQTKDALGYNVILGYDAAGAKTSVTDSLGNTLWTGTYVYGLAPFLTGEDDMDRGSWGYTVDALGERTAWTDPKGQHFYESYDGLSRPLSRTEPDLFTQWTWGSSAANHNIGKLQSVCTGTGGTCSSSYYSESKSYDSLGRLYQRSIAIPSMGTYAYTWQYNTMGYVDTLTYPVSTSGKALELKYAYHTGSLQSITDVLDSPNVTIWQADAQSPFGQITKETLANSLVTNRSYDAVTDWLASVQSGPGGGSSVQNQSFLDDEMGNVIQRQDNNLGLTENFYYDQDYRLSYSTLNSAQNLSLNYDLMGNITSRSDVVGGATWTYDSVHLHQVTEAGSSAYQYIYDANGNVTSRQGSSITWTSYNYPNTVNDTATGESVSFAYQPDRRAWYEATQSSSGTEYAYHVGGLLDIISSGGVTDYRHYIYAGSEPVAIDSRKSNGTNAFSYLLSDQEGSISKITNGSGTLVVGESFTAYGNRRNPTTWSGAPSGSDLTTIAGITRHGYTFQDTLGQMGLNDMLGRVQDAVTGRFLSPDPFVNEPTNTQDWNRYSYVYNNPATLVDPTGFDCGFPSSSEDFFKTGVGICAPAILPDLIPRDPTGLPDPWAPDHGDTRGGPGGHPGGNPGGNPGGTGGGRTRWPRGNAPSAGEQQIPCLPGVICDPQSQQSNPYPQLQPVQVTASYESPPLQQVVVAPYDPPIQECTGCWFALFGGWAGALDDSLAAVFRSTEAGTTVYRVFGGEAKGVGQYWTTVNPGSVANYRSTAGLFPGNTGQFVIQGALTDTSGVTFQFAAPGPGGLGGGLPEVFVPNPGSQIDITNVSGVNPPF